MPNVYYVDPGIATAINDEPTNPPLDPPLLPVTQAVYQQEHAELLKSLGAFGLQVTRSTVRHNPVNLQDYTLDDGRSYAVFIEDVPELDIAQVQFDLDGSPHNTEFSVPWDFNGTDVGGEAIKYVFTAGVHEIDAHITTGGGSVITLTATFEVD